MKKVIVLCFSILLVSLLWGNAAVFAANKITITPATAAIQEGQSQVYGIQLDSAITGGQQVVISITSSNPETATMIPSSITFTSSDWFQVKYFTADVPLNGTYGDSRNILIIARSTSGMSYYNGYAGSANLQVTDTTPEPGESEPLDPPVDDQEDDEDDQPTDDSEQEDQNEPVPTEEQVGQEQGPSKTASPYLGTTQPSNNWPGDADLESSAMLARIGWFTDVLVPGKRPVWHLVVGYALLTTLLALLVAWLIYFRRAKWWGRQRARDLRWFYRHRASGKPAPRLKSTTGKRRAKEKQGKH